MSEVSISNNVDEDNINVARNRVAIAAKHFPRVISNLKIEKPLLDKLHTSGFLKEQELRQFDEKTQDTNSTFLTSLLLTKMVAHVEAIPNQNLILINPLDSFMEVR